MARVEADSGGLGVCWVLLRGCVLCCVAPWPSWCGVCCVLLVERSVAVGAPRVVPVVVWLWTARACVLWGPRRVGVHALAALAARSLRARCALAAHSLRSASASVLDPNSRPLGRTARSTETGTSTRPTPAARATARRARRLTTLGCGVRPARSPEPRPLALAPAPVHATPRRAPRGWFTPLVAQSTLHRAWPLGHCPHLPHVLQHGARRRPAHTP